MQIFQTEKWSRASLGVLFVRKMWVRAVNKQLSVFVRHDEISIKNYTIHLISFHKKYKWKTHATNKYNVFYFIFLEKSCWKSTTQSSISGLLKRWHYYQNQKCSDGFDCEWLFVALFLQEVLRNLVKRYVAAMIRDAKKEEGITEENFKVINTLIRNRLF